ncbi:hypothetical protein Pla52o_40260 [Novipirellula galeiformis]|uniref:HEAT repeat protein n=1 Tax=Novipirellula galeiformis TaxID=2528004 RepID=A0A5C6CC32_9BACT|nr:hypothetical protein [Novipirellula galeiformis]TWU20994.1 hypothetical protein Pla52o_40260 [Novipirellula galeiformis]
MALRLITAFLLAIPFAGIAVRWCAAADSLYRVTNPPDPVSTLIEQLDSDQFGRRERATLQLRSLGKRAIAGLAQATHSESREVSERAFRVFEQHLNGSDTYMELEARATLETLAQSDSQRVSKQATTLLEPSDELTPGQPPLAIAAALGMAQMPRGGGVRRPVRIQLRAANGAARLGRTVKITVVNGTKSVEVIENNKSIKVEGKADGRIEVTQTIAGKPGPTKAYKNLDELKTQNPEAHKWFSQGHAMQLNRVPAAVPQPKPPLEKDEDRD